MSDLETLLARNERFTAEFTGGDLPIRPRFAAIVLSCVDGRVDPTHFLALEPGDAIVMRNTGGRVTDDVEHDVAFLWALMRQAAGEAFPGLSLAIVHHTGCGWERVAEPTARTDFSAASGLSEAFLEGRAISDHERSLRDDIERLKASPVVPDDLVVSAHLYDVDSGRLHHVVAPEPLRARIDR